jgi:hypothetical protein
LFKRHIFWPSIDQVSRFTGGGYWSAWRGIWSGFDELVGDRIGSKSIMIANSVFREKSTLGRYG